MDVCSKIAYPSVVKVNVIEVRPITTTLLRTGEVNGREIDFGALLAFVMVEGYCLVPHLLGGSLIV